MGRIFGRPKLPPELAHVPVGSRPATRAEAERLWALHDAIDYGGYGGLDPARRAERLAANAARNLYLLDLHDDGVSRMHLADLLGASVEGIANMLHAAGDATGRPVVWQYGRFGRPRPRRPERYPRLGDLPPAQLELLRAAWERYTATPPGRREAEAEALVTICEPYRRRRISAHQLADALDIPDHRLRRALRIGDPARSRYRPPH